MSNRPNLARKVTPKSEKKREDALDLGVRLQVDGVIYEVRAGDLNSLDTMALRRETGYSFRSLLMAFATDPDIDLLAALVWLARRIKGEQMLPYAVVAQEIDYDVDFDLLDDEAPAEDEGPEA